MRTKHCIASTFFPRQVVRCCSAQTRTGRHQCPVYPGTATSLDKHAPIPSRPKPIAPGRFRYIDSHLYYARHRCLQRPAIAYTSGRHRACRLRLVSLYPLHWLDQRQANSTRELQVLLCSASFAVESSDQLATAQLTRDLHASFLVSLVIKLELLLCRLESSHAVDSGNISCPHGVLYE